MIRNFEYTDVAGTPYEPIVDALCLSSDYLESRDMSDIKVANEIGCLIVPGVKEDEPSELIVFSDSLEEDKISPPNGRGIVVANTPEATEMERYFPLDIGVYSVLVNPGKLVGRPEIGRNGSVTTSIQAVRRLGFTAASDLKLIFPKCDLTSIFTAGSKDRHDGDAEAVAFATPPRWQRNQHRNGIIHRVPPRSMLIKGRNPDTELYRIGTFPHRDLAKIQSV